MGEQEQVWENIVCSCVTEKEAKQKLKMLLSTYVPLITSSSETVPEKNNEKHD